MKSHQIKAKGSRLLEIASTLILVFGIIAGLLLSINPVKQVDYEEKSRIPKSKEN